MNMCIVSASSKDIPEIASLERKCFSDPWSEGMFSDSLGNPSVRFFVLREDTSHHSGQIYGYAGIMSAGGKSDIINIAVSPEMRHRGYGASLMEYISDTALISGSSELFLEVRASNEEAIKLYRKLGFTGIGMRRGYYTAPREDAVVMHKIIGEDQ